ncbi:MAG: hypothetical protein H8E48_13170 [Chloroflexi bacterium]|nr:hypothetical protein [Chloroflexota bacterium]
MDKVIVTALLTIGAVTAAMVVIFSIGPSVNTSSQAVTESQNESVGRIRTAIEIIAVTSDAAGTQIDAWVKNVGVEPISPVNKTDVFVITPGTRFDAMTFNSAGGDNTWTDSPVDSIWNRGDTLHIVVTLPAGSPLASGDHRLRVSTRNGIVTDKIFSK